MNPMILTLIMLLISLALLAQDDVPESRALDEVVVKETFSAELKEEKLPVLLKIDLSEVIRIPEKLSWASIEANYHRDAWGAFPVQFTSAGNANIHPAPVQVFNVNFRDLQSWEMNIFKSNGELFFSKKGEGDPPAQIPWEGKNNYGQYLFAGHNYAYSFTAVDRAGNKKTFPGSTFVIPAAFFVDSSGVDIRIANSEIFDLQGTRTTAALNAYLQEISLLVKAYSRQNRISVYSQHPLSDTFLTALKRTIYHDFAVSKVSNVSERNKDCLTLKIE